MHAHLIAAAAALQLALQDPDIRAPHAQTAGPSQSAMICRVFLRVVDLPAADPVLMLRRAASRASAVVAGLPSGTVVEPTGARQGDWVPVRWSGGMSGFVHFRFVEPVAYCSEPAAPRRKPRLEAQLDEQRS